MPYDNRSYYIILKISLLAKEGQQNNDLSKAITKYVVPKNFLAALKMVSFSQLPAERKKTPFMVQLEKFLALLILERL